MGVSVLFRTFIFNDLLQLGPLISITGMITVAEAKSDNATRCSVFYRARRGMNYALSPVFLFLPVFNLIYSSRALKRPRRSLLAGRTRFR